MTRTGWAWIWMAFMAINVVMAFAVSPWAGCFDVAALLAFACFYKDQEDR